MSIEEPGKSLGYPLVGIWRSDCLRSTQVRFKCVILPNYPKSGCKMNHYSVKNIIFAACFM